MCEIEFAPLFLSSTTGSPLHRFKKPGSKNSSNIFEPSTTLHISNIAEGATEGEIQAPFREHGQVVLFKVTVRRVR